jgi:hypothetical protein
MGQEISSPHLHTPQIILFGDSLTALAFEADRRGFGWSLLHQYKGKAVIRNEGTLTFLLLSQPSH